jgi:hypothetical protein
LGQQYAGHEHLSKNVRRQDRVKLIMHIFLHILGQPVTNQHVEEATGARETEQILFAIRDILGPDRVPVQFRILLHQFVICLKRSWHRGFGFRCREYALRKTDCCWIIFDVREGPLDSLFAVKRA